MDFLATFSLFGAPIERTTADVLTNMGMSFLLSLLVSFVFRWTHAGYTYSRSFNVALIGVTMIVTMIMMVISNHLALSLGLIGAISVIRFRTAVKDPRDLTYLFLCIGIGLSCAIGDFLIATVGTFSVSCVMVVLHLMDYGRTTTPNYTLTFCLPSENESESFSKVAPNLFSETTLRSSVQVDDGTFEYVYHVSPKTDNAEKIVKDLRDRMGEAKRICLVRPEEYIEV